MKEIENNKGMLEETIEGAKAMNAKNISMDIIAECVGLSLEEVQKLLSEK